MTIFGGNDGIRDTWSPYGEPDMLARAMLIGMRNDLRRDEEIGWALECVTTSAARACGFADYGLTPGARADLALVDASCAAEGGAARAAQAGADRWRGGRPLRAGRRQLNWRRAASGRDGRQPLMPGRQPSVTRARAVLTPIRPRRY